MIMHDLDNHKKRRFQRQCGSPHSYSSSASIRKQSLQRNSSSSSSSSSSRSSSHSYISRLAIRNLSQLQ